MLDQEDSRQFNVHVPIQFEEQMHANTHLTMSSFISNGKSSLIH